MLQRRRRNGRTKQLAQFGLEPRAVGHSEGERGRALHAETEPFAHPHSGGAHGARAHSEAFGDRGIGSVRERSFERRKQFLEELEPVGLGIVLSERSDPVSHEAGREGSAERFAPAIPRRRPCSRKAASAFCHSIGTWETPPPRFLRRLVRAARRRGGSEE